MCKDHRFFICKHCGKIIGLIKDTGIPTICCGEPMQEIIPNTVEASVEKHLPAVTVSGDTVHVEIGTVLHPMTEEHHIEWVYLLTESGGQRKCLKIDNEPKVSFNITMDKPLTVFAYCNLHGLWKTEL